MKRKKRTFQDLVAENRTELLKNAEAIEKIEERIENRHMKKAE